jgi:hypothetical protein
MEESPYSSRTLGGREGAVVAWLEAERRATAPVRDVSEVFGWTPASIATR